MSEIPKRRDPLELPTRRSWLAGAAFGLLKLTARGAEAPAIDAEIQAVKDRARKAGLGSVRVSQTEHYVGIGDAPDAHRAAAIHICEELATVFLKHFADKGFEVALPRRKLVVVALKGLDSYAKYLGEDPGPVEGGHFDLETNRLVIFDFAPDKQQYAADAGRLNTFTLVHEELHQLTFNTGLLNLEADVPVALSEGLATYGELWQSKRRASLGGVNVPRLKVFLQKPDDTDQWIPIARLMSEDSLFAEEATQQLAYAESWALVHYLLKTPAVLPKFRAFLKAIWSRADASHRLGDLKEHLGSVEKLDRDVRKHMVRQVQDRRLISR